MYEILHKYVEQFNMAGESPLKRGATVIPAAFTKALVVHSTMMQVSAQEREAPKASITTVSGALKMGTDWEGKFNDEYAWRKTRKDHPGILFPVSAKNHEDLRAIWLTYQNINKWIDFAKKFLIEIGFVKDEPGYICKSSFVLCIEVSTHLSKAEFGPRSLYIIMKMTSYGF